MKTETLITLGLGSTSPLADALRPVIDGALSLVCEELFDERVPEQREMRTQLEAHRHAFARAADVDQVATVADACFVVLEAALKHARERQAERSGELAAVIALVRDAVAVLTGEHDAFYPGLGQAADRFGALVEVADPRQLRLQLMVEVRDLRKLIVERQQQWQSAAVSLESRVSALETQMVQVREEVSRDPLTGICNRRRFEQAVAEHVAPPARPFVLAIFDIDDLKRLNDSGGHQLGDHVLMELAQALRGAVRADDVVGRLGGDEFGLLASGQTLPQMAKRLSSIVAALANVSTGLDSLPHVTASCGAAEYSAGDTVKSVMARADQALYEAKRAGKNRVALRSAPFIRDLLKGTKGS